jgi:uncharacterized protein involved in exopolysaccharide biosynthesis
MNDKVSLTHAAYLIMKERRRIVALTAAAVLVAIVVSLLLPKWYRAHSSVLPPETGSTQADIVGIMRYAGYQPAMLPTVTSPAEVYSAILKSDEVTNAVIDSLDLMESYGYGTRLKTIKRLRKYSDIGVTNEGLVVVSYEDKDRERSAEVANAYIRELDRFNREIRGASARKVREFIEGRLEDTLTDLEEAESGLRRFKEKTGAVLISDQTRVSIETAAELFGEIAGLEMRLARITQFATEKSPEVMDLRSQIRALNRKLAEMGYVVGEGGDGGGSTLFPSFADAPQLEQRLATLMRDVEIKRAVYQVLSQQYEEARIQELKDTPTIQVLDRARPPLMRSRPKRKVIVGVTAVAALVLSSFVAFNHRRAEWSGETPPGGLMAAVPGMVKRDLGDLRSFLRGKGRGRNG